MRSRELNPKGFVMDNKKKKTSIPTFIKHYGPVEETYIRLFLYVTEEGLQSIIQEKKIRLSCPWRTNDITEGVAQGEDTQDERCRAFGYVCFSAVCDSPSMWGYYAGKGQGACLVFDFPVCQQNEASNEGKDDFLILRHGLLGNDAKILHKIRYQSNRLPKIKSFHDERLLLTKSPDWQHEKEYRIIYRLAEVEDTASYNVSVTKRTEFYDAELLAYLSGIILGPRCNLNAAEVKTEISLSCEGVVGTSGGLFSYEAFAREGDRYAACFSLYNAKVIRANIDQKTFAYKVESSKIKVVNPCIVASLLSLLQTADKWIREPFIKDDFLSDHYTWLITEAYRLLRPITFGEYVDFGVAKCKDEDDKDSDKSRIGIFLKSKKGERFVIPYVYPEILKHTFESAKSRAVNPSHEGE